MPKTLRTLLLAASLCLTPGVAHAWGDMGHMVVGQVAYARLDPAAASRVRELSPLVNFRKRVRGRARRVLFTYTPVSLAVWMDDVRDVTQEFDTWHYVNKPIPPVVDVNLPPVNVESKLNEIIAELRAGVKGGTLSREREARLLAFLFHLVGDVHQPMHAASRWSDANNHDRGGGRFPLTHPRRDNLHSYWDAAGGYFNFGDPGHRTTGRLRPAAETEIRNFAFAVASAHPKNRIPNWQSLDVSVWVNESYDLAQRFAYGDISPKGRPGLVMVPAPGGGQQTYEQRARDISARRIATAGYRLAALLNDIYRQQ